MLYIVKRKEDVLKNFYVEVFENLDELKIF